MARRKKSPAHRERRIQVYTTVRNVPSGSRGRAATLYAPRPLDGQAVFQHRTFKRVASHHGSRPTRRTPAAARRPAGATAARARVRPTLPTDVPPHGTSSIGDSFTPHTLIIKTSLVIRICSIYLCMPARKRSQDELIVPSVNVVPPRLVCVTSGGAFLHGERNIGVLPDRNTQLARD